MAQIIQFRRDNSTQWTSINPTLAEGELGLEKDSYKVKIGDGTNVWTNLPYRFAEGGAIIQGSGTYTQNTGTVQFQNSNSITFGLSTNGVMTASFSESTHDHPYLGSGASTAYQTGTLSTALMPLVYSSGFQTATLSNTFQTTGAYLTTAMASQSTSVFQFTSATSAITVSAINTSQMGTFVYTSASSLFQHTSATSAVTSAAFPSANTTKFAGSGTTIGATAGTLFKMTLNSVGLNVSVPAYLTTAALSANTSTQAGTGFSSSSQAGVVLSVTHDTSSPGLSMLVPAWITTAANSTHSHGNPTLNLTNLTGTIASASNGLTLSLSGPSHGNLYFVDSNGHTFSSSVSGVSTSIWINT